MSSHRACSRYRRSAPTCLDPRPHPSQSGPIVIDNSSAWRMDPNVPLVVPEINMDACKGKKLIANPNCTTAIALMALYPLHKEFGIKKCIVSTYQARKDRGHHARLVGKKPRGWPEFCLLDLAVGGRVSWLLLYKTAADVCLKNYTFLSPE